MPPKTERRTQHSEESRRKILQAAAEIATERGYDGTSVALVTKRSGLPASSVYWHFGSKDELLAAVIEHSHRDWLPETPAWQPPAPGVTRLDHLRQVLRDAGRTFASHPTFMRLGLMLMLERRVVEPAARARFLRIRQQTLEEMSNWWAAVLPPEVVERRPKIALHLAQLNMAAADGLYAMSAGHEEGVDLMELQDLLATALDAVAERVIQEVREELGEE